MLLSCSDWGEGWRVGIGWSGGGGGEYVLSISGLRYINFTS